MTAYPKPMRLTLEAYRSWICKQPCVIGGCKGQAETHHVRYAWNTGAGTKPSDTWVLPACRTHHDEFHTMGREPFAEKHRIDLLRLIVEHLTEYMWQKQSE